MSSTAPETTIATIAAAMADIATATQNLLERSDDVDQLRPLAQILDERVFALLMALADIDEPVNNTQLASHLRELVPAQLTALLPTH